MLSQMKLKCPGEVSFQYDGTCILIRCTAFNLISDIE